MGKSQDLYIKKAKKLIPGGTQLYSKQPERLLPGFWPAYYERAKGCKVWDLDEHPYIDTSYMGIGSCILGYADRDVDRAVLNAIKRGSMSTLNCPEEIELAELLCKIHQWADMTRFARTGGEAMAIGVRIARAQTEKEIILVCGYHGWHDWYLAANLGDDKALDGHLLPGLPPKGVPRGLKGTVVPFNYNDNEGFLSLIKKYKSNIAAVVMEPVRSCYPKKEFLETIRETTKKLSIVLVFDEITAGWRLTLGGSHLKFKVYPDIAVFAKGISNGYPMAAIIGREEIMQAAQETFISSTYWTERIGPVAALATIKKLKRNKVYQHLIEIGEKVQKGWRELSKKHNLNIIISGISPVAHFSFGYQNPLVLETLFTQLMLKKGFLATSLFYASYAHNERIIERYLEAVEEIFSFISRAIKEGDPKRYLKGPVHNSGFMRLT